jgi:hypothetical protein
MLKADEHARSGSAWGLLIEIKKLFDFIHVQQELGF